MRRPAFGFTTGPAGSGLAMMAAGNRAFLNLELRSS
jgi:hypothetical protein